MFDMLFSPFVYSFVIAQLYMSHARLKASNEQCRRISTPHLVCDSCEKICSSSAHSLTFHLRYICFVNVCETHYISFRLYWQCNTFICSTLRIARQIRFSQSVCKGNHYLELWLPFPCSLNLSSSIFSLRFSLALYRIILTFHFKQYLICTNGCHSLFNENSVGL